MRIAAGSASNPSVWVSECVSVCVGERCSSHIPTHSRTHTQVIPFYGAKPTSCMSDLKRSGKSDMLLELDRRALHQQRGVCESRDAMQRLNQIGLIGRIQQADMIGILYQIALRGLTHSYH